MNDIILLKEGEMVLKGLNKKYFETRLLSNLKRRLAPYGDFHVYALQSTVYAEPKSGACDMDGALAAARTVFGAASVTRAAACEKEKDAIVQKALEYLAEDMKRARSFKVETRRADKRFPMTSIQLSQYVGGRLAEAFPQTPVDVRDPDLVAHIEVRDFAAYVHGAPHKGAGGLPVGTGGRCVSLLSGGIDSPAATWMMARRGLEIVPVHFFSFPYTSEKAKEKVVALAKILTRWCGRMNLQVVPFTRIQEEIGQKCPEALFTVIMRRFMMRIAQDIADWSGCGGIATGENLGQVASQTLEAMAVTEEACRVPVLRPLVGMDKEEIVSLARRIGTFDTSVLPYEDCCTVFTPRHPRTKPALAEVLEAEKALDADALVREAVEGIERIRLDA